MRAIYKSLFVSSFCRRAIGCALFLCCGFGAAHAAQEDGEIAFTTCLVTGPIRSGGRVALHRDPVEAQIVAGTWRTPTEGSTVPNAAGLPVWHTVRADKDGWLSDRVLGGGYACVTVRSDTAKSLLLEARGHTLVYVNGEPRAGDPYDYGYVRLPVTLKAGENTFLFLVGRGRFRARLVPPAAPVLLDGGDPTLPDVLRGESLDTWGGIVALNTTGTALQGWAVEASAPGLTTTKTPIAVIPAQSLRKVAFSLKGRAPKEGQELPVTLRLVGSGQTSPPLTVRLRLREPLQTHKCTFRSKIDGSVQYYALNPAQHKIGAQPALILSLHGASVEAIGQADAYAPKTWAHLVAPTNRRPYGFDWEDWGRLDAIEVMETAQKRLRTDPRKTYLTGHSMGGHGTWQIGATFPDRFAAIAPSAGWISFYSYGGGQRIAQPNPVEEILQRSAASSDTLAMSRNYLMESIYILHGSADDNVPVTEAQYMNKYLAAYHPDFTYHEEPGAGHWWGSPCVDWNPLMELFTKRILPLPTEVNHVEFTTLNPGVSASAHWLTIAQQTKPLAPSTADISLDRTARRFTGKTTNVALLALDVSTLNSGSPYTVVLDGQTIAGTAPSGDGRLWLERRGETWRTSGVPSSAVKNPARSGTFKLAFQHEFVFVYGTGGTPEENAWAFAKARFDAETFYYRGNGAMDVLPDTTFQPGRYRDRSVILYGNARTNRAWKSLLGDSPIQVEAGKARLGEKTFTGEDLACLFLRPRRDSRTACVAVIGGTGLTGMRLTDRLPIFLSGAGFPDCLLVGANVLTVGSAGVRAAGFFGNDWKVETGDFVWKN